LHCVISRLSSIANLQATTSTSGLHHFTGRFPNPLLVFSVLTSAASMYLFIVELQFYRSIRRNIIFFVRFNFRIHVSCLYICDGKFIS